MKIYAVTLLAIALTGCVMPTKQPSPENISPVPAERLFQFGTRIENTGALVVTRDIGLVGSACYLGVLIDGALAAKLEPGERATFHVPSREHVLTATWVGGRGLCSFHDEQGAAARRRSLEVSITSGATKNYRIYTNTAGDPTIEAAL